MCTACRHDDVVHDFFVGCCLVTGCGCTATDGRGNRCRHGEHDARCDLFTPRAPLPENPTSLQMLEYHRGETVTPEQRESIVALKHQGKGRRTISRELGIHHTLVRGVLQEEFGVGVAAQPRTRPRREDWARAMDAGITNDEYQYERHAGGKAGTVDALNAWIASLRM